MNCPILQWSATEIVQSFCETSLKPVKLNFVVSVLLVEQFSSWNVAHQQYLKSLVHSVPHVLWGYCPCCEWVDCRPHLGMLSLQTGRLMSTRYYKASSLQECITAEPSCKSWKTWFGLQRTSCRPHTRICSELETVVCLTIVLFLRLLFSPLSWFGLVLLFSLLF